MHRDWVGAFQNWCFWVWLPVGSQTVDGVVWPILALGLDWLPIPRFGSVHGGIQTLIRLRTHLRFQVWAPSRGFRCARHPGAFIFVQAAGPLIREGANPGFQVWAPGH